MVQILRLRVGEGGLLYKFPSCNDGGVGVCEAAVVDVVGVGRAKVVVFLLQNLVNSQALGRRGEPLHVRIQNVHCRVPLETRDRVLDCIAVAFCKGP